MLFKNLFKYRTTDREPFYELFSPYISKGQKILDIGAGDGSFSRYFHGYDVINVDNHPINNTIKWVCPEPLPFDDYSFDAINCSHFVEHLHPNELYSLLLEMDRILKIDGKICISAPMISDLFYNDLSHVRPYHPGVFTNYLCSPDSTCRSRITLGNYKLLLLQYRYSISFKKNGFTAIFHKHAQR